MRVGATESMIVIEVNIDRRVSAAVIEPHLPTSGRIHNPGIGCASRARQPR
jgi:hypothetical protein